jgi:hypothetical protein
VSGGDGVWWGPSGGDGARVPFPFPQTTKVNAGEGPEGEDTSTVMVDV